MAIDSAELDSGLSPPVKPYAFDQNLLERVRYTGQPEISIYAFAFPAVVAGRGTDLETEILINRCVQDRIPVFRRRGGGCSVFLDPGTLIVSMALPAEGFSGIQRLFNLCNRQLIQALEAFGLDGIYQDGISDLVLADRKVGGSSFFRSRRTWPIIPPPCWYPQIWMPWTNTCIILPENRPSVNTVLTGSLSCGWTRLFPV